MVDEMQSDKSLSLFKTYYYYERHTFIIDTKNYVDMVVLSSMESTPDGNNKKITKYNSLSTYSEELPIKNLALSNKKQLLKKKNIEEIYFIYKDEYERFSDLEGKELFTINPKSFKSYNNH